MHDSPSILLRFLPAVALAVVAVETGASTVDVEQAKTAASHWRRANATLGCRVGESVASARTCTTANGVPFYVVKFDGGGFAVMSSDTELAPVVAFSDAADLVESDDNPLWTILNKDFAMRGKAPSTSPKRTLLTAAASSECEAKSAAAEANEARWAKLLPAPSRARLLAATSSTENPVDAVSDIRVAPLVRSKWGQSNDSIYTGGNDCYNIYTPGNRPCGCVATAVAQLIRFHEYPTAAQPVTRTCIVNGVSQDLSIAGVAYAYDKMPLVPESNDECIWYEGGTTEEERQAIGQLARDCSVAMCMNWNDGTGAWSYGAYAHQPLREVFHYQSARTYFATKDSASGLHETIDSQTLYQILCSNLDAKSPVLLGIYGSGDIAHEVVADGYGYSDGQLFTHINGGWNGMGDAWYLLPDIPFNGDDYTIVNSIIYNVFPDRTGDIVSGRILSGDGVPIAGARVEAKDADGMTVSSATTDANGIYALVIPDDAAATSATATTTAKSFLIKAEYMSSTGSFAVNMPTSSDPARVDLLNENNVDRRGMRAGNSWGNDIMLSEVQTVASPRFSPSECSFLESLGVTITCPTEGATIMYTTDGSEPDTTSNVAVGRATVTITETTTLKAKTVKAGMNPSPTVAATYTYDEPPGDSFARPIKISGAFGRDVIENNGEYTFESGEPTYVNFYDNPWLPDTSVLRTTWYEWTAPGSGEMTFSVLYEGYYPESEVAVYTGDSLSSASLVAYNDWYDEDAGYYTSVTIPVVQGQTYRIVALDLTGNDPVDGDDGARLTFKWKSEGDLTVTVPEPPEPTAVPVVIDTATCVEVPYAWFDENIPNASGNARTAAEYQVLADEDSDGDGLANWQEYILQTDPANGDSKLNVEIRMKADGTPDVSWSPTDYRCGFRGVLMGTNDLSASPDEWVLSETSTIPLHFFRVVVVPQ